MLIHCLDNDKESLRVRITPTKPGELSRIGGCAPDNTGHTSPSLLYFLTVVISRDPEKYLSVFVAGYDEILDLAGELCGPGKVQCYVHDRYTALDTKQSPNLTSHGLRVESRQEDFDYDDGERVIKSGHKLGGQPYLIRCSESLRQDLEASKDEGFIHLLQIDFPDQDDDTVSGDWPFGDGIFHIWVRPPYRPNDFRWQWDF